MTSKTLGKDCNDFDSNQKANGDWYFDGDGDGYHNTHVNPILATCTPLDNQWILLENSLGPDCDDDDTEATLLLTWYYDGDDDNYYGITQDGCENPGLGTPAESKWSKVSLNGEDCDDTDPEATTEDRRWYFDGDGDNHYGSISQACQNPGKGTPDEQKWSTDVGGGVDCDDINPEVFFLNACGVCGGTDDPVPYYIDLDGDGYHSVLKEEDCGLNTFSGVLIRNSDFPESLIPEDAQTQSSATSSIKNIQFDVNGVPEEVTVNIPNTNLYFTYNKVTDQFHFPSEVLSYETLGLDCDDLNPATKANGLWYADADGDGYHSSFIEPTSGCTPPSDAYILFENSKGPDCDDEEALFNVERTWYKDTDGDGYFVDFVLDCRSPGFGWNLTSSAGVDDDDTNPFTPHFSNENFILPSLLQTEVIENVMYVNYLGEQYRLDQFSIMYRGVELKYEDLIFDRVAPENRLLANTLLAGNEVAIYDAQIVTTIDGVSAPTTLGDPVDPELKTEPTEWIQKMINNNPAGYSISFGSVSFGDITNPNDYNQDASDYFDELFDPTKFGTFKDHYQNYGGTAFTLALQSFEADFSETGESEVIDEKFGDKDLADVVIMAKKFLDGHAEFVVFIRDDEFKATEEELIANTTWLNPDGSWKNPNEEAVYKNQLGQIQQYRNHQLPVLALDYQNETTAPSSPTVSDLPSEVYPTYNFGGGLGVLTKWYEFLDIGHYLGKEFKMPRGTWDLEFVEGDTDFDQSTEEIRNRESAERWRLKSPSSVAGFTDGSLQEVRDYADMFKLAKSLVYRETWDQILESIKNISPGEVASAMLDMFDDKVDELQGNDGIYVQYHSIGEVTARTIATIISGWNSIGRIGKKLLNIRQAKSPVNKLKKKFQDLGENFANVINKSPDFKNLTPDLKRKLIDDLATSPKEFGELLAKNDGELINAWAKLGNTPIRLGSRSLQNVSKWLDEGIEVTFEAIEDGAKILGKNGDELGTIVKQGAEEVLEISDDFIVDAANTVSKKFEGLKIASNTGETFINAGFVKNLDGTLGFVEDVSSYGSQLVQNTIKKRGALRKSMTAIKATEDAHHIIPVQLLKQNDVVKKAVEAGFEFNTTRNGLAIEKFVKATGKGRHGPHPKYTQQISQALERFRTQTPNYTNQQAKEFLEIITDDIKNTIQTTSGKINDLSLGL